MTDRSNEMLELVQYAERLKDEIHRMSWHIRRALEELKDAQDYPIAIQSAEHELKQALDSLKQHKPAI